MALKVWLCIYSCRAMLHLLQYCPTPRVRLCLALQS